MRHRIAHRKLGRTKEHRIALRRNLAQSLFEHGEIRTTLEKAKDVRPFAERLITLARKAGEGSLIARRRIHKLLGERSVVPAAHQEAYDALSDAKRAKTLRAASGRRYRMGSAKGKLTFTGESIIHRLITHVAPRYSDRPGGYTRIIRLAERRIGDHGNLAVLQLVGDQPGPGSVTRRKKVARRKRTDARYAAAVKLGRAAASRTKKAEPSGAAPEGGDGDVA